MGCFFLHQGTRQIYNAILPQIQSAFDVDSVKMGLVGTVFTITYGVCAPLSGVASDFLRRKWMVVFGLLIFAREFSYPDGQAASESCLYFTVC